MRTVRAAQHSFQNHTIANILLAAMVVHKVIHHHVQSMVIQLKDRHKVRTKGATQHHIRKVHWSTQKRLPQPV